MLEVEAELARLAAAAEPSIAAREELAGLIASLEAELAPGKSTMSAA